jgi:hypothetical protein
MPLASLSRTPTPPASPFGEAGGLDDADVLEPAVRQALDLVERAVVGGVQRPRGAVGGHAGGAAGVSLASATWRASR